MASDMSKPNTDSKRPRISVDLSKYPDVKTMLDRAETAQPGTSRTWFVVSALREELTRRGYARKRELAK